MTSFLSFDPWADLAQSPAEEPAATPPPENEGEAALATLATLATLAGAHAEIDFFSPDSEGEDWRERFEERLAVAMVDGEQAEAEARQIAYDWCVVMWLDAHSVISESDRCAGCGRPDRPGQVVPFGAEPPGHAWLHPHCWANWHAGRRAEAVAALAAMRIAAPARLPVDFGKNGGG